MNIYLSKPFARLYVSWGTFFRNSVFFDHITENHDDLASYYFEVLETIENPEFVMRGNKGSLKATKNMGKRCILQKGRKVVYTSSNQSRRWQDFRRPVRVIPADGMTKV